MVVGGHFFIWPIWVCASEQGIVSRVLSLKELRYIIIQLAYLFELDAKPWIRGVKFMLSVKAENVISETLHS